MSLTPLGVGGLSVPISGLIAALALLASLVVPVLEPPAAYADSCVPLHVTGAFSAAPLHYSDGPSRVAVDDARSRVHALGQTRGTFDMTAFGTFDGVTGARIRSTTLGKSGFELAVNSVTGRVYVADNQAGDVQVIDGGSGAVVDTIPVPSTAPGGARPFGIAVNPMTNTIYVVDVSGHTVTVIDGTTNGVVDTIALGVSYPQYIAVNPTTNQIYVTSDWANTVWLIDGSTNDVVARATLTEPSRVAVNQTTGSVYVVYVTGSGAHWRSVAVYDGTLNPVASVKVLPDGSFESSVWGIAVDSSDGRVYVSFNEYFTAYTTWWLAAIDGENNTVVARIPVGPNTTSLAADPASGRVFVADSYDGSLLRVESGSCDVEDVTPPSVSIATPPDGAVYHRGDEVIADFSCSDDAGLTIYNPPESYWSYCNGAPGWGKAGSPIDTATVGAKTFTVTATDEAGNSTNVSHAFTVLPRPGFVLREGTDLRLDGQPYRPVGINIYNANSNGWCWYAMDGTVLADSLTAIGSGKNAMRAWFFQQLATASGARDWTAFDRTLATARAHGYKVVATLVDQWGNCGATNGQGYGYKDADWYESGYTQPDPSATVSYRDWVYEVVSRYKDDPTILAWQLVNEPEVGHCTTVPEATAKNLLMSFASDVSGLIKLVDPDHLTSLGTLGSGQCGAQGDDYKEVMSVPTLDLCEFHDYTPSQLIPGDQWNGLQVRINQCDELGKPLLVGEIGVKPSDAGGSFGDRADVVSSKLCAQFSAGVAGALVWAWNKDGSLLDNFDIGPGDPVLDVLSQWSDPNHSCSPPGAPRGATAAAGDGKAAVAWVAPADDGGAPVTSYTITASPGGVTKTVSGKTTRTTVLGLTNGTSYTFAVTARNAAGTGVASSGSPTVTPRSGATEPAAAAGIASATSATTVTIGSDPATTGGATTSIAVPTGTSGGLVSVTQSTTSQPAPTGYIFGQTQFAIAAPTASATNPLRLVFTVTPIAGETPESMQVYRTEGSGTPTLVGPCGGPTGEAVPNPCVASRRFVTINTATYIELTVLSSSASDWNTATPRPGAVSVSDAAYVPQSVMIQPGANVNWSFVGRRSHSATDSAGLGASGRAWFDSGAKTSGSYRFTFPAAGTFAYRSTVKGDSMTGTVVVPVLVTPPTGRPTSNFSIIWSTRGLTGYVFDVQYRFRPAGSKTWTPWAAWRSGVTATSAMFVPNQGAGEYAFRARLRNRSTGNASGYSSAGSATVS